MDWVSEEADHKSQTCAIRLKDTRLPDLDALDRHLRALRLGAWLGGVEATVVGRLELEADGLLLELSESGERLPLAPLRAKVQWSLEKQQAHPMTRREQDALARLHDQLGRRRGRFEVVGPLVMEQGRARLEVRCFRALPDDARRPGRRITP